jgi:hypothetical protein
MPAPFGRYANGEDRREVEDAMPALQSMNNLQGHANEGRGDRENKNQKRKKGGGEELWLQRHIDPGQCGHAR